MKIKIEHLFLDCSDTDSDIFCPATGVLVRKRGDCGDPDYTFVNSVIAMWDSAVPEISVINSDYAWLDKAWRKAGGDGPDAIIKFLRSYEKRYKYTLPERMVLIEYGGNIASHIYTYVLLSANHCHDWETVNFVYAEPTEHSRDGIRVDAVVTLQCRQHYDGLRHISETFEHGMMEWVTKSKVEDVWPADMLDMDSLLRVCGIDPSKDPEFISIMRKRGIRDVNFMINSFVIAPSKVFDIAAHDIA